MADFQYPILRLVLSHSSRSSLRRCTRLLEFGKMYGDSGDREEMFAAECGKALHVGFQHYLIHKNENAAVLAFMVAYPHDLEFGEYQNQARSLEACFVTLMEMIKSDIVDQYELVYIKTRFGDERAAIEVPFAIEITNSPMPIPVWFVGFIDAIFYDRYNDRYLVSDIKTTRMNIKDYSARYEFDEQTVPYGVVLEHILGVKIEEFKVSYLSAYIDILEPRVNLYTFTKTQDHIHDWYRGLCEDIGRIAKYYKTQWWPRATDGNTCFSFNRPCYHTDICSFRDPEVINRMIAGNVREGLFHDNQSAWVEAKLEYMEAA